ncbi:hypothetical protein DPMN_112179 [Dreissena polymorpha]|uniref:Alpha-macroglobulin-like TED domain-containing protein n=1 Tax=Dreissena polymorpha TaxID=45954 RepID=A0A9D4KFY1_DREPO|nr:hypothetical protein DPMN_112179 [Dreissena polymorpha]
MYIHIFLVVSSRAYNLSPGDTRFWENSVKSQEIEIAGYALLAYARLRDTARGLPVLRWLVKQRTPYGGFLSTQVMQYKEMA